MTTNEYYDNLETFIKDFSHCDSCLESQKWGLEFLYNGKYYRMTFDQTNDDATTLTIKNKFKKPNAKIELFEMPITEYPSPYKVTADDYIGVFDSLDDLISNCIIEDVDFANVITSKKTRILGYD